MTAAPKAGMLKDRRDSAGPLRCFAVACRPSRPRAYAHGMEGVEAGTAPAGTVDHRALAVALLDISSSVRRKPYEHGVDKDDFGVASALAVFLWAAGASVLIAPIAVLLINIDRRTFSGTAGDTPVHLG